MSALRETSRSDSAPTSATETPRPAAARATRKNHRDFGAPTAGTWFGRDEAAEYRGIPVTIERHGRRLTVRNLARGIVDDFDVNTKFWFVPEGTPGPSADEIAAAVAAEAALQARLAAFEAQQRAAAAELAESHRQTAELLAASPAPVAPARSTWAAVGRPETLVWFGRDIDPGKPLLVTFNEYGNRLYDARTGQQVAHYGSDCPQWYAPVPAAQAVELPAAAPTPVVIVPCGARKRPGRVRAAEKYCGPYARSARLAGEALAERTGARVITLSARFGLLEDDDLVDDYDLTMGEVGCVTAGRVAEQAARLGITDSLVTVIAGKAYADVVSAVWPHAVRALDGCTSYGNQRARMGHIARGHWSPVVPVGATATPALFGAELVAPTATTPVAAGDLVRGDVLAPGTFNAQHTDPVLVTASARPVDQPDGRRRVSLIVRPLPYAGHSRHLIVWADAGVDLVGRDSCSGNDYVHPPAEDAEILDGPALSWPRLLTVTELRAGDVCAPGAFGPWNKRDTITVVTDPVYCDTVAGVRRYDIGTRVNLRRGPGAVRHGALRADSYVPVLERPTAPTPAPAVELAPIVRGAYVNVPRALAEHAPVPADTTVVLAASRYGGEARHIVYWALPTHGLCRTELMRTEAREEHFNADTGLTRYRHLGVPVADATYGYPADAACEGCRDRFAKMTRETLPHVTVQRMKAERRADRERRAAQRAARLAGEVDPTTVEPVDLAQVVAEPAPQAAAVGAAADLPVPVRRRELVPVAAGCGATSAGGDFRSRVLRANRHTAPGVAGLVDPVNLHDYDVVLVNVSAGKDSMALLVAVVELALAQGYDLGRIIAVHCDLGRVEWAGTAELAAEHAREMGVNFVRVANKVDLLDQVRQRKRNLVRKAGELREAAEAARAVGDVAAASLLAAQSAKKAATPAWFSSAARYCTKSQKTGEVEKLMTALAKVWREAGNTDRPIRILNTLGIRADESPARALKKPFGPDSATNTRRTVTRWLPIFTWSEEQVWATIRASALRVHGAYQINMSRLSCALCVLGSRQDLVTAARANRGLVDEYADVEDEVEATFQNGTSVREIGAEADRLGPLELPAPASLKDLEAASTAEAESAPAQVSDRSLPADCATRAVSGGDQQAERHAAQLEPVDPRLAPQPASPTRPGCRQSRSSSVPRRSTTPWPTSPRSTRRSSAAAAVRPGRPHSLASTAADGRDRGRRLTLPGAGASAVRRRRGRGRGRCSHGRARCGVRPGPGWRTGSRRRSSRRSCARRRAGAVPRPRSARESVQ